MYHIKYLIREIDKFSKIYKPFKNEPEAIFKAAQWILDNVKTNSIS